MRISVRQPSDPGVPAARLAKHALFDSDTADAVSCMIKALDHVALAVTDLDGAIAQLRTLLGRSPNWRGADGGAAHAWFQLSNMALDVIAPIGAGYTGDRIKAHLDAHGEGIWLLAFATEDIQKTLRRLGRCGVSASEARRIRSTHVDTGEKRYWTTSMLDRDSTHGASLLLVEQPPDGASWPLSELEASPASSVSGLDHVVVTTAQPERAAALYGARLDLEMALDRTNPEWNSRLMFFRCGDLIVEIAHDLRKSLVDRRRQGVGPFVARRRPRRIACAACGGASRHFRDPSRVASLARACSRCAITPAACRRSSSASSLRTLTQARPHEINNDPVRRASSVSSTQRNHSAQDVTILRRIGRWDLVALMINVTIGAGILGLPAKVFSLAGGFSVLVLVLCAALVGVIAICFAEIGSRFQDSGGPYLIARTALGPAAGFIVGWLYWISRVLTFATICNLLVAYVARFIGGRRGRCASSRRYHGCRDRHHRDSSARDPSRHRRRQCAHGAEDDISCGVRNRRADEPGRMVAGRGACGRCRAPSAKQCCSPCSHSWALRPPS